MATETMAVAASLNELNVLADDVGDDAAQYLWTYWRRPDGWIVVAPGWDTEIANYVKQGWVLLSDYGQFTQNDSCPLPGQRAPRRWDVHQEPYRGILTAGGSAEFDVQQIVELGW